VDNRSFETDVTNGVISFWRTVVGTEVTVECTFSGRNDTVLETGLDVKVEIAASFKEGVVDP